MRLCLDELRRRKYRPTIPLTPLDRSEEEIERDSVTFYPISRIINELLPHPGGHTARPSLALEAFN